MAYFAGLDVSVKEFASWSRAETIGRPWLWRLREPVDG